MKISQLIKRTEYKMIFLFYPVPLWMLLVGIIVITAMFAWNYNKLKRRIDALSTSTSNMDEWADVVEDKFTEIEGRLNEKFFLPEHENGNLIRKIARPNYR